MTDIIEIPLDIEENIEDIQETVDEIQDIPIMETPKKRGRPAGAKNKEKIKEAAVKQSPVKVVKAKAQAKAKAKATAAPKKKKKPVVEEYSSSEDETPRARPQEMDRQALAAEMLQILSQQRGGRATARREHYATWFQ